MYAVFTLLLAVVLLEIASPSAHVEVRHNRLSIFPFACATVRLL